MSSERSCSLNWRLVSRLVALQAGILIIFMALILSALWSCGYLVHLEPEDAVIAAIGDAAVRDADGGLALRQTPELTRMRREAPDLWFSLRDRQGRSLSEGAIPPEFAGVGASLDGVGQARLGWNLGDTARSTARMKWITTASAGDIQVLTGPGGSIGPRQIALAAFMVFASVILPTLALMTLATVIATPLVVRRALAGLDAVAAGATLIDVDDRGARLPVRNVPREVIPLVRAVNDALGRLDEGYERRQRFLTDAAHELRTPIAILGTRLQALHASPERTRLLADLARLSTLADQLLDLQRVALHPTDFGTIDLVDLGRQVTADLAPLAIAAGFEMSFEAEARSGRVMGDRLSLERVLTNLVQNAIDHAGRKGCITVRVASGGILEVADEGAGIPEQDRSRIFEPFQRLRPRSKGAGLGLHLVSEIVRLHRGSIKALEGSNGGARFRITLPTAPVEAH
ncbi:HAMP domain-containing sensor histidine kinase [Aquabacter sp. CN5-332]|uniref:sensor histidine kinase n=1 Tax=Aquabacter sp. CN5-332 TaxID=3156608 RepID=UPI0032B5BCBD